MKEGRLNHSNHNDHNNKTWLERISDAFLAEPKDQEQLINILRDAEDRNLLASDSLAMIEGAMHVSEMQVRDIMIPRSQMAVVEKDAHPNDFLPTILESAHSRFPVISDNRDEVIGILLAKDLLSYFAAEHEENFDVKDIIRTPVFVPESKRLNVLLKEFRATRNHMAIVINEYGGVAGLVTIEDVLEQIVGEIEDEHDIDDDTLILMHTDDDYSIKAITPIEDFNAHFNTHFSDEEFDTIGGLVLNQLGHLPKRGESIQLGNFHFNVVRADNRRIHLLQLTITHPSESQTIKLPREH